MTTTLATCRYCGTVCADDDKDTAVQLLADHQWRAHPEAVCACGHVRAEHAAVDEQLTGGCRRCGCTAFVARTASAAQERPVELETPAGPQSCYPEDVQELREMLAEQRELLAILEAKRAEGKRAAALTWAIVRCQSRIGALRTAIEVMGGAL